MLQVKFDYFRLIYYLNRLILNFLCLQAIDDKGNTTCHISQGCLAGCNMDKST